MENIVAARRLRKSALKEVDMPTFDSLEDIGINTRNYERHYSNTRRIANESENESKRFITVKNRFLIKIFLSVLVVFVCLVTKLLFADSAKENKYIAYIISEYKKDYSKEQIADYVEEVSKKLYNSAKYVIPEKVANYISTNYVANVKPRFLDFELKSVFKSKDNNETKQVDEIKDEALPVESNIDENIGMGGGEPIEEIQIAKDSSSVSLMLDDVSQIVAKNINIISPLSGTITSNYGARDQIFDGVNPYHTGTDIGGKKGTPIHSATDGVVKKVQNMDKYYGNNIEIEIDGVTFKYAHMSEIKVKENDTIKQGDVIGLVGDTGMVTGPHLHFEIKINARTVDPEQIVKL